ncbi:LRR 8 domain containing protein [Asbolus verrucosus]|uniref:LRR 8 domain containing protein n=1 Tax=Asbolus verrucosus TaxID=1661398 RepID=A0A482WDQ5_ASBVE|nr:LRR 8 domain containing protein [Asbolus verrucosus]
MLSQMITFFISQHDWYPNEVKIIAPGAFVNLSKLKGIRFSHNNLTKINITIFSKLTADTNFEIFKQSNSKYKKILFWKHAKSEEFENVYHTINELTDVTIYMLEDLTNLKMLNIGFNKISSLEPKSFAQTRTLHILVLQLPQSH